MQPPAEPRRPSAFRYTLRSALIGISRAAAGGRVRRLLSCVGTKSLSLGRLYIGADDTVGPITAVRRRAPRTVSSYVRSVAELAKFHGKSPDLLEVEEIRDFVHYLIVGKKLATGSCNHMLAGIHFFYRSVLGWDIDLKVPTKSTGKLPEPLSRQEIERLLDAARIQKHRVLMMIAYGAGLRASELVRLQPDHIHSDRLLIRVNQGKRSKDRYTLLSPRLLEELREYWRKARPQTWFFPHRDRADHMPSDTPRKTFDLLKARAGIKHGRGVHSLRHSFATHLLEAGVDLRSPRRLIKRYPIYGKFLQRVSIFARV